MAVDMIMIVIGNKQVIDDHNDLGLYRTSEIFLLSALKYPSAQFLLSIDGYDEDERELWEIPEVMRYIKRWAQAARLTDGYAPILQRIHDDTIGLLVLADAFGIHHPYHVNKDVC